MIEENEEIEQLKKELDELRSKLDAKKNSHEGLKEQFILLYHVEGEKNAELTNLRGDTSKQLASNQEFQREIEKFKQTNYRMQ